MIQSNPVLPFAALSSGCPRRTESGPKIPLLLGKTLFFLLFCFTLLASGCSKDDDERIDLSQTQVTFTAKGGKQMVQVQTGSDWTVVMTPSGAASWLTLSASSGQSGSQSVVLTAEANLTAEDRTVELTFRTANASRSIRVTQPKNEYTLDVSPLALSFKSAAGSKEISVRTNAPTFTGVADPASAQWCTVEKVSSTLFVKLAENKSNTPRETSITVTAGSLVSTVQVQQEARSPYFADQEVEQLQTATRGQGINLVLMGDGFVNEDLKRGGRYETVMRQTMDAFFDIEPYRSYRDYFNVYFVAAESPESGVGGDVNASVNNKFGSRFTIGTGIDWSEERCKEYIRLIPGLPALGKITTILILNSRKYAGTTIMYGTGFSIAACPLSDQPAPYDFKGVVHHEAGGHGFGRLDDEYIYFDTTIPEAAKEETLEVQSYGMCLNVDFTGDPSDILWTKFIDHPKYPQVGAYEGAQKYRYGIWRAEYNSCMNDNIPYFNAPSRWLITRRIMELAGQSYTFSEFITNDQVEAPSVKNIRAEGQPAFTPLARPRMVIGRAE